MKNTKIILGIFIILLISQVVFAHTNAPVTQIATLNAKFDLLRDINNQILNTVYWTLGVLAAIFLGLISANLYFNVSANKREIEKIRESILNETSSQINSAEAKINEKIDLSAQKMIEAAKESILASATALMNNASRDISEQLQKNLEKDANSRASMLKNEFLIFKAEIMENTQATEKKIVTAESSVEFLKKEIVQLQIDLKEINAFKYSQEGKMGAIINYIDLLEHDLKNRRWFLRYRLPQIKKEVSAALLDEGLAIRLRNLLKEITENEFQAQAREIEDLIRIEKPNQETAAPQKK